MYWTGVTPGVIGSMSIVVWSTARPKVSVSFSSIGKPKRMPPPVDWDLNA
jgi:hypothetical protein